MKYFLSSLLLIFANYAIGQYSNDFENPSTLEIQIDSTTADTIWQIGVPNKTILNETSSEPNALLTDTINTYPVNTDASFIVELNQSLTNYFPFLQLEWFQKTDFEEGVDGGVIDVSYDQGETWLNIFNDTTFLPELVGNFTWDTLHNGQAGLTGVSDLSWMAICWGSFSGTILPNPSTVQVRFTLTSDSTDTNQDGWLIDNFNIQTNAVGSTSNRYDFNDFDISPNPVKDFVRFRIVEVVNQDALVYFYDNNGRLMHQEQRQLLGEDYQQIAIPNLTAGVYYMMVRTQESIYRQKVVKVE